MNYSLKIVSSILFLFVFTSCKTSKSITSSGELDSNLSTKQIIKNNAKSQANFKTLVARIKADYYKGDKSNGTNISLRMEKDKTIWMSAPFSMAKILITPDKVSFYNKLDNTYFVGDFKLLSDFVGTELDFYKVQNILIGEALFKLDKDKYESSIFENSYLIQPKKQLELFEIFYLINPAHFKIDSQQLAQPNERRFVEVDYKNYQEVDNQIIPQDIKIIALDNTEETTIQLEFKSVVLNEKVRFPFKIPSGYKELEIK